MTVSVALSTDFPGFKVSHSSQPVSRNSRELFGPENYLGAQYSPTAIQFLLILKAKILNLIIS